jgi:NitT/TauT family transport system ATP-binding protein
MPNGADPDEPVYLHAVEPVRESRPAGEVCARVANACVEFRDPSGGAPRRVLNDVSLDIREGEFVALVGKSGSGKTTLLNVLSGLVELTSGTVDVLGTSPRQARDSVGYMFARDALLPWRTARKNVEFGLEIRRVDRQRRRELSRRYLDLVGITESASKLWPWQLSQGMRQRVALARTWALEPRLLLLDEPFSALDAHTRESVQQEFLRLWEEHKRTVVFVTHDLSEAIVLADRVVLIGESRIVADVSIDFERPRDIEDVSMTPEFQSIRRRLRRLLDPTPEGK